MVLGGQAQGVVFSGNGGPQDQAEVQQTLFHPLEQVVGVGAEQVEPDLGIAGLEPAHRVGQQGHAVRLPAAEVDVPGGDQLGLPQLGLGFLHQGEDLVGPLAQQDAVFRQGDVPAAPDKQGFPDLLLQHHQLPGQGGLGEVEGLGGAGDALLPGHCEKIPQHAKLHSASPFPCFVRGKHSTAAPACQGENHAFSL